jgi:hypothetical protein
MRARDTEVLGLSHGSVGAVELLRGASISPIRFSSARSNSCPTFRPASSSADARSARTSPACSRRRCRSCGTSKSAGALTGRGVRRGGPDGPLRSIRGPSLFRESGSLFDRFNSLFARLGNSPAALTEKQWVGNGERARKRAQNLVLPVFSRPPGKVGLL